MAILYKTLKESSKLVPVFISTSQHRQMLDQSMSMFGITPDFDMNIMEPRQSLASLTARLLLGWEEYFKKSSPSAVLVQGDTTTVLSTSIAAFYHHVPIGHVEAGLRTFNLSAPFPEEMNRCLTDPISRWHFAHTKRSYDNLLKEGTNPNSCFITGNTVIDSLLWMRKKLISKKISGVDVARNCNISKSFAENYLGSGKPWILVTGHRRENFGNGFENICSAIKKIVDCNPDVGILYPVHLNPNVKEPVNRILRNHDRIELISPVDYANFIWLMDDCKFVLSDSGGVQEEAPSLGKPVLVMRNTTERPEGVDAGTCTLVGTDKETIFNEASRLLSDDIEYKKRSRLKNPYGDGKAAERITKILEREL